MGQKTHPKGFRIGMSRKWDSYWYAEKEYRSLLEEDTKIRKYIMENYFQAAVALVEIERFSQRVRVTIHTARPGILIGRRGAGVEELRKSLEKLSKRTTGQIIINVQEVKQPELEAKLLGENIAEQLVKRIAFRRAIRQAAMRAMKVGAKGVRIQVSGRLAGAEIARSERIQMGKVPLHTLRADIDFAVSEAYTTYGRIGVKVWIYRGDAMLDVVRQERRVAAGVNAKESQVS